MKENSLKMNYKIHAIHLLKISILIFIVMMLSKCSSRRFLPECNDLSMADSTEYYVTGLIDHHELKKDWLKEEIKKENIEEWFKDRVEKEFANDYVVDSLAFYKMKRKQYEYYLELWNKLTTKITIRDKIFYYSTPDIYWKSLAGQDGLAIIRECHIMYVMILSQS